MVDLSVYEGEAPWEMPTAWLPLPDSYDISNLGEFGEQSMICDAILSGNRSLNLEGGQPTITPLFILAARHMLALHEQGYDQIFWKARPISKETGEPVPPVRKMYHLPPGFPIDDREIRLRIRLSNGEVRVEDCEDQEDKDLGNDGLIVDNISDSTMARTSEYDSQSSFSTSSISPLHGYNKSRLFFFRSISGLLTYIRYNSRSQHILCSRKLAFPKQ